MRVLIADDDELIADLIRQNMLLEGFETLVCHNGTDAYELALKEKPDLVILDVMLPGLDGFHVCRKLQGSGIPIIMLTAKGDITDKLTGLEAGADDYIVKPFDTRELVARVHTIFRRLARAVNKNETVSIDEDTHIASIGRQELDLTPTEFNLLLLLSANPGRVFTRAQLLDRIWGYDFLGDSRVVDIQIQRLRKKLGKFSGMIETEFGVGYRYREQKT